MNRRAPFLALVVIGAAMFALPALASAGEWDLSNAKNKFPQNFTVAGGTMLWTTANNKPIDCASVSGSGKYDNETTGTLALKVHGCTTTIGGIKVNCTTSGQPVGTIETTALTFHNVMLEPTSPGTPGILITPNATTGVFAHFVCGGIASITWTGNGIIGDLTQSCGTTSKTAELNFEAIGGTQRWRQITTTGTIYDPHTSTNGGAAETLGFDFEATTTFEENQTITCP